jgi:steroid 5-alpha reductase family enzyme
MKKTTKVVLWMFSMLIALIILTIFEKNNSLFGIIKVTAIEIVIISLIFFILFVSGQQLNKKQK